MPLTPKRRGFELEIRTFKGKNGMYLVFRERSGAFHVFAETEAKEAARDCGMTENLSTREMWRRLWIEQP